MVVFGAPEKLEDHEIVSVRCAMEMREKLDEMNQKWDETEFSRYWKNHGIEKITARTGIHTGSVIAGNIGSNRMLQYSTIGDTVNVASRICEGCKDVGADVLISEEVMSRLSENLTSEKVVDFSVRGRSKKIKLHKIVV